jgi:hypothetical protein
VGGRVRAFQDPVAVGGQDSAVRGDEDRADGDLAARAGGLGLGQRLPPSARGCRRRARAARAQGVSAKEMWKFRAVAGGFGRRISKRVEPPGGSTFCGASKEPASISWRPSSSRATRSCGT